MKSQTHILFKAITSGLLISIVLGCASPGARLNQLSLGMTKEQVIDIMGTPDSTKAMHPQEILVYSNTERPFGVPARTRQYWVVLQAGKVYQYGEAGDFGNAAHPTQRIIIEKTETIKPAAN